MRLFVSIFIWALLLGVCVAQDTVQTGEFNSSATAEDLLGKGQAESFAHLIPPDEPIEWSIYVPVGYNSDLPAGVLVFISAGKSGKIPREWKTLMDKYNLIWIAANMSGNKVETALRVSYAIFAPSVLIKDYALNDERIYISGFSGGGRVASMAATEYAHIFKGAIYNSGVNFWGKEIPKRFNEIKRNRYVFIAGAEDFNLRDTKKVYHAYQKTGVKNIKLMVIPSMAYSLPRKSKYEEAIDYLDSGKN